jgi:CIC family chloride channel protein
LALRNQLPLDLMMTLIFLKTAATAICLASRFGGGIFSPSLYVGAMTGGAFGLIAASAFPEMASSEGLYAILGMGAVAAAVIGAPLSTTMIVFELTGGYTLSIALLLTVSIATGITIAVHGRSYFYWQLGEPRPRRCRWPAQPTDAFRARQRRSWSACRPTSKSARHRWKKARHGC